MKTFVNIDKSKDSAAVKVHGLSHDGRGIATVDNKTTFIAGALPTETVTYKITQKRSTYNEANMLEVLTPAENRATPPCQHFGVCGGCSLQHMSIAMQIELKQQTLLDQLKHFGKVIPKEVLPPLNAGSLGYRRKGRLGAKFVIKKDKLLVGFREKSSRYLADIETCPVLHPSIGEKLPLLRETIAKLAIFQHVPQIEIAIGDTDTALVFRHLEPMLDDDRNLLIEFGKNNHYHIYLQPNAPAPLEKIWPADSIQRLSYTLDDFQLEFLFHPLDFTQINLEMNRLMVKQAIDLLELKATDTVLDLFSGIGNFTLPIAKFAHHVTGVEGGNEMVTRAADNAAHNKIGNVSFYAANLEEPPKDAPWMQTKYNKILLDPPRTGAKAMLPFCRQLGAKRIVYVSCNPATLARDAGELVHEHGYRLQSVGIMNMFPHTSHIEAMAVFERT